MMLAIARDRLWLREKGYAVADLRKYSDQVDRLCGDGVPEEEARQIALIDNRGSYGNGE